MPALIALKRARQAAMRNAYPQSGWRSASSEITREEVSIALQIARKRNQAIAPNGIIAGDGGVRERMSAVGGKPLLL